MEKRWKKHIECVEKKVNRYLYDAMNHYGKDNFNIEIIEQCPDGIILNEREKFWISFYKSTDKNFGYNMQEGGIGGTQPEEIRKRAGKIVSIKRKGHIVTKETREKISKGHLGLECAEETKKKLSLLNKGKIPENVYDKEIIEKRRITRRKTDEERGYHNSKETREKIGNTLRGKPHHSDEEKNRRMRKWLGQGNPNYKDITKDDLIKVLQSKNIIKEVADYFGVAYVTIFYKCKLMFNKTPAKIREESKC